IALTFLSTGTGEPDDAKVSRPVRRGAGRKGGLSDLARGLPYLVPRSRFRQQLRPGVRLFTSGWRGGDVVWPADKHRLKWPDFKFLALVTRAPSAGAVALCVLQSPFFRRNA